MEWLKTFAEFVLSMLSKNPKEIVEVSIPIGNPPEAINPFNEIAASKDPNYANPAIDWTNPECKVTTHFTVSDCLMLHSWNRLANEAQDGVTDGGKAKLITLCQKMEEVRVLLGCPINVHCMYRSPDYNAQVVKAIPDDVHAQFLACDFDCGKFLTIDQVHGILEPFLEKYGIRMERNTPTWVHLDLRTPGPSGRYFTA